MIAETLERSHVIALSGTGVSGHQLLRVNVTKGSTADQLDCFMDYVRFAQVHLDKLSIIT